MKTSFPFILALLLLAAAAAGYQETQEKPEGDDLCLSCHAEALKGNPDSPHVRPGDRGSAVRCEACHGDGARHAVAGEPQKIRSFKGKAAADVCKRCHHDEHVTEWKSSRHAEVGVDCVDCHAVHRARDPQASCKGCH